jgi:hypothetical protein
VDPLRNDHASDLQALLMRPTGSPAPDEWWHASTPSKVSPASAASSPPSHIPGGTDEATSQRCRCSLVHFYVADRLAQIGELRTPTRRETEEFLVEVLLQALRQIPSNGAAWSWGEFHNAGLQPLYDISSATDWPRLAVCAAGLGLAEHEAKSREGEVLTPLDGLSRDLTQATERLLRALREHLERLEAPRRFRRPDPSRSCPFLAWVPVRRVS